jgi:iron complex outermembrane receptor protein
MAEVHVQDTRRTETFIVRGLTGGCCLTALHLLLSSTALAQVAAAPTTAAQRRTATEEVQVTALRRSAPLQKTPASIQSISAATLKAAGVTTLSEAAQLVPNFDFHDNFRAGVPYLSLRGIPTAQGGEAPVTVLIDGVQAPGLDFINVDLVDIASIEVLRGPQGALYGRGAIAGALLINTTQPTNQFHDHLIVDYGNGNTIRVADTASGPLIKDMLWAKATYQYKSSDGLIYNPGLHEDGDFYHEIYGNLELLAKPREGTTIELQLSHLKGTDGASQQNVLPDNQIYNFTDYYPNFNLPITDNRRLDHYVFKLDQLTPIGTFSSISQYAESVSKVYGDADFSPAPVVTQLNNVEIGAFNQDLRLTSLPGSPFQWILGAFEQYRDTVNFLNVSAQVPGLLPPGTIAAFSNEDQKSLAYAGYGQASMTLPYNLTLSGGLRYDVDQRYDDDRHVPGSTIRATFSALQPSGTVSEQFNPDLMGYVTIGRGFRSGGFNALEDTENFAALVKREFPEETVLNYEGGVKSSFFDHKLTVNASVFHSDYKNEQFYFVNVSPPSRDIISIGKVSINGGELEVNYHPLSPVILSGGFGIADSTIESDDGSALDDKGKHSPNSNQYNWNLAAEYDPAITETVSGLARVDFQELGPIWFDAANHYAFHPTGYLNARLGARWRQYSLAAFGKNITNTRYATIFSPDSFGAGVAARLDNLPATYGMEFTADF